MNIKRTIGIFLLVVGIIAIFYANHQKALIAAGGAKAYQQINQGNSLFQGSSVGEAFGGAVTGSAKKKVASEVARYNQMVQSLLIGGIVVAVIGGGLILFSKKKTKKKR